MTSPLVIECHVEDQLPAGAVALTERVVEAGRVRVDVLLSKEYPLEVIAEYLGKLMTTHCAVYGTEARDSAA